MQSKRALHQAVRAALDACFSTDFCKRQPYASFDPAFLGVIAALSAWPTPERYGELARLVPQAHGVQLPRFVAQDREALDRVGGYEQHVATLAQVPTRPRSWHDFFNMATWAHFPRLRWALNAVHVDLSLAPVDPRNGRAPAQNLAAQFDESGLVVASSSRELLSELRALRFKHVFWQRRAELDQTTRFWVVGHGALESLLAPHLGLAGKAILLELPEPPHSCDARALRQRIDAEVALQIQSWQSSVPKLDPVPLLGIPGFADNDAPNFYDDAKYFRFERRTARV